MFILIEPCDFHSLPVGGQLSFCRQLANAYGGEVILVGVNTEEEPIGRWFKKSLGNFDYWCFNLYSLPNRSKPIIPLRLTNLLTMLYYRKKILEKFNKIPIFIHSPEVLIGLCLFRKSKDTIWYMFHGVENPLSMPRYKWGKIFSKKFEYLLFKYLQFVKMIFVCGDSEAISKLNHNIKSYGFSSKLIPYHTRYDDSKFFPTKDKIHKTNHSHYKLLSVGRLNKVKGWQFLLDVVFELKAKKTLLNIELTFVGDGEDRFLLENKMREMNLNDNVRITGFSEANVVREYLTECDLVLVGSYKEGWSISMLEALACGKPIVSTNVSGAKDMIKIGKNGFICNDRDPSKFADLVADALENIPSYNEISLGIAADYRLSNLRKGFDEIIDRKQTTKINELMA